MPMRTERAAELGVQLQDASRRVWLFDPLLAAAVLKTKHPKGYIATQTIGSQDQTEGYRQEQKGTGEMKREHDDETLEIRVIRKSQHREEDTQR